MVTGGATATPDGEHLPRPPPQRWLVLSSAAEGVPARVAKGETARVAEGLAYGVAVLGAADGERG